MHLVLFLFKVFIISFSGAIQPGPVTAATIALSSRYKYAGGFLALGHAIIEFPLMILIVLGMDIFLKSVSTQIVIGLAGGVFLLIIGIRMWSSLNAVNYQTTTQYTITRPLLAGLVLSAGNPYFLLWWATVGLALATEARTLGIWAFVLFTIAHWLCDFIWLQALSWANYKGSILLSPQNQHRLLKICSIALFGFGLFFVYNSIKTLIT